MKFEIAFRWTNLERGSGEPYRFPDPPTAYMRKYRDPGVYRWAVLKPDGTLAALYVGEAEDLERRLKHYLKPGKSQFTNLRMKAILEDYLAQGMQIYFQFVVFDDFRINSCEFVCGKLSDPFVRKTIENLVILDSVQLKCKVLNKGTDLIQKKIERVYKVVPEIFSGSTAEQRDAFSERLRTLAKNG